MRAFYNSSPLLVIGDNTFRNVPTILQFENTPLLEVTKVIDAGYAVSFPVFHQDGTYIARVRGSRIHITDQGKTAALKMRFQTELDRLRTGRETDS